jgi:hypothetical protein
MIGVATKKPQRYPPVGPKNAPGCDERLAKTGHPITPNVSQHCTARKDCQGDKHKAMTLRAKVCMVIGTGINGKAICEQTKRSKVPAAIFLLFFKEKAFKNEDVLFKCNIKNARSAWHKNSIP